MNKATKKIQLKVERKEAWYPVVEVPIGMTADEAREIIYDFAPEEVYSEYFNKNTYDLDYEYITVHRTAKDDAEVQFSLVDEEPI